ncbi:MAG TPA: twin-arginine translocation signal domain-containing protein, partial [Saprospiraceae bacterium]|nr:twin-arginine translocation signal domain-containing protein [Saprospiraceae bacterium]
MKRRDFLKKAGLTVATAPIALNNIKLQTLSNSLLLSKDGPN